MWYISSHSNRAVSVSVSVLEQPNLSFHPPLHREDTIGHYGTLEDTIRYHKRLYGTAKHPAQHVPAQCGRAGRAGQRIGRDQVKLLGRAAFFFSQTGANWRKLAQTGPKNWLKLAQTPPPKPVETHPLFFLAEKDRFFFSRWMCDKPPHIFVDARNRQFLPTRESVKACLTSPHLTSHYSLCPTLFA